MKSKILIWLLLGICISFNSFSLTLNANATQNNGSGGIFVSLTTNSTAVNITSFNTIFSSAVGVSVSVDVYMRTGPYAGFTGSNAGWTSLGTINAISAGTATEAPINLASLNIQIPPSTTQSFYFHATTSGGGIKYFGTSTVPAVTTFSDANLTLFSDVARTGTAAFGGTANSPRAYSGSVDYTLAGPTCAAPTGLTATGVTASTANTSWTAVSGSLGYEYDVTTSSTPPATGTATTATSYSPPSLSPGTTYYLHVRNKCGASSFSSWATYSFTTLCPATTTPTITGIGLNGATINWTAVTGAAGYEYAVTTSSTPPASGTGTTTTSYAPTTLNAGTTYYAHVRTKCGTSTFSTWTTASFTTLTCAAPAAPTVSGITQSGANISWTAVSGAAGYEYAVTTSSAPPASGTGTTATSYNPNTLTASTVYYVHLRTQCNSTTFSVWTTKTFTTSGVSCTSPATPTITGITQTSANINWTAVGGAIGYEYAVTTSSTPPATGTSITTTTLNPNTLTAGTTYYIHVRTKCGASVFSAWTSASFTTVYPPCPQTAAIVISNVGFNSANIKWLSVMGATAYEYVVSTSATPPATGTTNTDTFYSAINLIPSTKYYVHVRSKCPGNQYSGWVTNNFTTSICTATAGAAVGNITYTSADISWPAITGLLGYEYAVTTSATPPATGIATTATTYTATALTPATAYYVHIRSKCATGSYSTWTTTPFNTLTCGTVLASASNINFTSADINWTAIPGSMGYEYLVTSVATPPNAGTPTTTTNHMASNLMPNTTYYVHLRNICAPDVYSSWSTISFNTLSCGEPINGTVSDITQTTAKVSWTAGSNASSYEYAVTLNGAPPINLITTTSTNADISNLQSNTTYNIHMRTVCANPQKSNWTVITFRTSDVPTGVANINNDVRLNIYPNPAHDYVTVKINGGTNKGSISVTDISGRVLQTINAASTETIINTSALTPGVYLLKYSDGETKQVMKLTKE